MASSIRRESESSNRAEGTVLHLLHRGKTRVTAGTNSRDIKNTSNAWVIGCGSSLFNRRSQLFKKIFDIDQVIIENLHGGI
jgi:hypothetical protein